MNRFGRLLRHLVETRLVTRRRFPPAVLDRIEAAVAAAETTHAGELRVVIETDLDAWSILAGRTPRQRAIEVFAGFHVWDTELNNGVLLYVLCADRDVEIVCDRGFNGLVTAEEWRGVCQAMETEFRAGRWQEGALAGIAAAGTLMARHYPASGRSGNELPDRPALL
ncbi:MAG TPA: TPM domain-containing protein [Steroidobacteraceae bacterium]|nr:TPM domain-containing protein [Steroidobacteraceae bacterium]